MGSPVTHSYKVFVLLWHCELDSFIAENACVHRTILW